MVGQLVEAEAEEVHEHDLGHGTQAPEGGPDGRPHDGLLRDGRVADPVGAVLGGESLGDPEDTAAGIGDVLTEEDHAFVGPEGLVERPGEGGADAHLDRGRPGRQPPVLRAVAGPDETTSVSSSSGPGSGRVRTSSRVSATRRAHSCSTASAASSVRTAVSSRRRRKRPTGSSVQARVELVGRDVGHPVAEDVAVETVGERLDQGRPLAGAGPVDGLVHGGVDGEGIVAVDGQPRAWRRRRPGPPPGSCAGGRRTPCARRSRLF